MSNCPGGNFLLSLCVCHRHAGVFSIGINKASALTFKEKSGCPQEVYLPEELSWQTYRSGLANENHYITTFNINKRDVKNLENKILCIPIKIDISCKLIFNNNVIKQIKLKHDFGDLISKQENTDFILESVTKRQFPVHQIIIAVHSPVLGELIKNSSSKSAFVDIHDHQMELLLQFIYTGTIKDVHKIDCLGLRELADRFQLKHLSQFAQNAVKVDSHKIKNFCAT